MNLKLSVFILILLANFPASAQRQSIGIQDGAGLSFVRSDVFKNQESGKVRLNSGITYERTFGRHGTLGADLLYQQRGFSDFFTPYYNPFGMSLVEYRFNYLALPLKIGVQSGKKGFAFGRIGVVPAYLVKSVSLMPNIYNVKPERTDNTDKLDRFDIGGIAEAGGGYRFRNQFQLYASLAFQHSITSFATTNYFWGHSVRMYGLYFNLGFRYGLPQRKAAVPGSATAQ